MFFCGNFVWRITALPWTTVTWNRSDARPSTRPSTGPLNPGATAPPLRRAPRPGPPLPPHHSPPPAPPPPLRRPSDAARGRGRAGRGAAEGRGGGPERVRRRRRAVRGPEGRRAGGRGGWGEAGRAPGGAPGEPEAWGEVTRLGGKRPRGREEGTRRGSVVCGKEGDRPPRLRLGGPASTQGPAPGWQYARDSQTGGPHLGCHASCTAIQMPNSNLQPFHWRRCNHIQPDFCQRALNSHTGPDISDTDRYVRCR